MRLREWGREQAWGHSRTGGEAGMAGVVIKGPMRWHDEEAVGGDRTACAEEETWFTLRLIAPVAAMGAALSRQALGRQEVRRGLVWGRAVEKGRWI